MLTRNRIREIKSLENKKERTETCLFAAEGKKLISDLLDSDIAVEIIYSTPDQAEMLRKLSVRQPANIVEVPETEIKKISHLKTPQGSLALCRIPRFGNPGNAGDKYLSLCLDDIQDPGNFGTIIRLADWFGIRDVFCSPGTVDIYNPKVVQATMGAISRVRTYYLPLVPFMRDKQSRNVPVYGTFPDGENIYTASLTSNGIIILGNEGKGINRELFPFMTMKITIPGFHSGVTKPDSLNVSVAASIIVSEFRRRRF